MSLGLIDAAPGIKYVKVPAPRAFFALVRIAKRRTICCAALLFISAPLRSLIEVKLIARPLGKDVWETRV